MMHLQLVCVVTAALMLLLACEQAVSNDTQNQVPAKGDQYSQLDHQFSTLVDTHQILTAGAAIIENGEVVWTGYFGEQAPGLPASASTQFNVGSVTKTFAAEVILRLVADGEMSLDESMSSTWVDPDIANDPRHELLTPRIALIHKTGFPNWRFFTNDGKLKFQTDPGDTFSYSGEGFEYLASFAENRTGRDFDALVAAYIIEPLDLKNAAYSIDESNFDNIAQTKDSAGAFPGHYCYPENGYCRSPGSSTPADDLVITIEDYATFLISVMKSDGYGEAISSDRNTVQSSKGVHEAVDCDDVETAQCPVHQGYGLGWEVLDFGDNQVLSHGGSDWHELALAYYDTASLDGIIVFLNAPSSNALRAMPDAITILDSDSPLIAQYKDWLEAAENPK